MYFYYIEGTFGWYNWINKWKGFLNISIVCFMQGQRF